MSNTSLEAPCLVAGAVGIVSHILYWVHGHHDPHITKILGLHLGIYVAIASRQVSTHGAFTGLLYTTAISASYLGSLFTSITIYRLFFHRLRHFPGPFAAKITKLYGPWMAGSGKMHEKRKLSRAPSSPLQACLYPLMLPSIDLGQQLRQLPEGFLVGSLIYNQVLIPNLQIFNSLKSMVTSFAVVCRSTRSTWTAWC